MQEERQQAHTLMIRVQATDMVRRSKKTPGPAQDPLPHSHNANQSVLIRCITISWHRASTPLEVAILQMIMAVS